MRSRATLLALLLLLSAAAALAGEATAHAYYVSSSPTSNGILPSAPSSVTVTLSESIKPGTGSIHVTNYTSGVRVENGTATISSSDPSTMSVGLLTLGPGCYQVAWTATDAIDGHWPFWQFYFEVQRGNDLENCLPSTGESVGGAPISVTEIALRFGLFLGLAIAFGAALLAALVWVPTSLEGEAEAETVRGGLRALFLWGRVGAVVFTVTVAGLWSLQWTTAAGSSLIDFVGSPYIASLFIRLLLGFGLLAAFAHLLGADRVDSLGERSPALWAPVALCVAAIAAEAFATHAAASTAWAPLSTLADAGHLTGVTAWVGGLLVLVRLRAWFFREDNVPFSRQAITRFSQLAFYAVGAVLIGGVSLAVFLVGSIDALVGTVYGWVVLAKISLFAPMLAMGALNHYRHIPEAREAERAPDSIRRIARNVRWESTMGAVVLALAATLTALAPPVLPGAAENVYELKATVGTVRFDFFVSPAPAFPGNYTYSVLLWNTTNGFPFSCNCTGNITYTNVATGIARMLPLDGPHGNHFVNATDTVNAPGTWRIDIDVKVVRGPTIRATFYLQFRRPGG